MLLLAGSYRDKDRELECRMEEDWCGSRRYQRQLGDDISLCRLGEWMWGVNAYLQAVGGPDASGLHRDPYPVNGSRECRRKC